MDVRELRLCVVFMASVLGPSDGAGTDCLTIGVAADVSAWKPDELTQSVIGYSVTYVWYSVNTDEIFHVYNAVQRLEENKSVDVIIHGEVSQASLKMSHLLQTKRAPLIQWGVKTSDRAPENYDNACAGENTAWFPGDTSELYCAVRTGGLPLGNVSVKDSYADIIPGSVTKLLVRLKWKQVILIHDAKTELAAFALIDQLSLNEIMMIVINIDDVENFENMIFNAYQEVTRDARKINFVVACRHECARKVVRVANTFDDKMSSRKQTTLLKQFSMWLIALYGYEKWMAREIRACADNLDNVAIIAVPDWTGSTTQTIPEVVKGTLMTLVGMKQWGHAEAANASCWKEQAIYKLKQAAASRHPSVYCQGFNIDTLLWAANDERSISNVGYIDMSGQIMVTSDIFPNTKYGYNKRKFLVSTLEYKPFVMSNVSANGTKNYFGFCLDLLEELASTLNFTYTLTRPEDGNWGTYIDQEKELFNGLVGQLQRREVDITAAPLTIQADRERQMDFAYPFFYEVTTVLMKRVDPMKRKWRTLIDPFQWQVHVSIGIALTVVTMLLWILEKWNPFYKTEQNAQVRQQDGGLHYWHNSFWYMYGALLCQGGVHLPDSVTGRTFVSCWWLFCIIIVGTYCGNLIAFLTVTKDKPAFSNLKELVSRKGEFQWGIVGGSSWENAFIHSTKVHLYMEVGDGLVEFNRTDPTVLDGDPAVHIKRVLEGGYAWIGDRTSMDFHMATECDLAISNDEFFPMSYGFGFQNNSPHGVIFADQLIKIHESGLLKIWKRKWWPRATFCQNDRIVTSDRPVTLMDVQSAFYVCVIGISLGLLAFIAEIAVHRYRVYRDRKQPLEQPLSVVSLTPREHT